MYVFLFKNKPEVQLRSQETLLNKNKELLDEWEKLRRDYVEDVHKVIANLRRRYNGTKDDLLPSYEVLKRIIKDATSDLVIEKCEVPNHKYSIYYPKKNKYCKF